MRNNYLLPNSLKKIGLVLFVVTVLLLLYSLMHDWEPPIFNCKVFAIFNDFPFSNQPHYFSMIDDNIANELIGVLGILSLIFLAFSKEKQEDEFIAKIRLDSLLWATYANYAILLISIIFIYGMPFFWVLVFNMYTILIVFIIRFHWMSYQSKNNFNEE